MKSKAYLLFVLILLLPASILSVSASTEEPQNELPIMQVLNGVDGVQEIPLKAIKDTNNNIEVQEDYSIGPDNVVNVEKDKNFVLMPNEGTITKVEAIDTKLQEHDLYFADNLVKADLPKGSYILNVILTTDDGTEYGFVTILVILAPTQTLSEEHTQGIIDAFNSRNIDVTIIFKDDSDSDDNELPEEEPSICFFDPNDEQCDPDEEGNCPEGFGMNEDGQCIPHGPCPQGFHRANDDETGRCIDEDELRQCANNGGWVEEGEFCPEDELPFCNVDHSNEPCISGQEEETEPECEEGFILENDVCTETSSNCGGEPCTPSQKEDSTTSDPVQGTSEPSTTESEEVVEEIEENEDESDEDN